MSTPRSLHFDVQNISRTYDDSAVRSAAYRSGMLLRKGVTIRSVVASAAYRSGELLRDESTGQVFDYSRKEDIRISEIMAPKDAPDWARDRQALWNHVEAAETRKNSRLAKDIIAVFPRELSADECAVMMRRYVNDNFVSKGLVADFSIHVPLASDGMPNPHGHIMVTTRAMNADGFGKKDRSLDQYRLINDLRKSWEDYSNYYLHAAGHDVTVTLQSYKSLGIDKTPGVHMGDSQWHDEQRGKKTPRGDKNRGIKHENVLHESLETAQEHANMQAEHWDVLLEMLNPEPEREAPVESLETESLSLGEAEENSSFSVSADVPVLAANDDVAPLAAEVEHYERVDAYVSSGGFEGAQKEVGRAVNMKRYANRFVSMAKDLSLKAYQQIANLLRETIRERDRDKGYER